MIIYRNRVFASAFPFNEFVRMTKFIFVLKQCPETETHTKYTIEIYYILLDIQRTLLQSSELPVFRY